MYQTGRLVYARSNTQGAQFNLEITVERLDPSFIDFCKALQQALYDLVTPTKNLRISLQSYLARQRDTLELATRNKIDSYVSRLIASL